MEMPLLSAPVLQCAFAFLWAIVGAVIAVSLYRWRVIQPKTGKIAVVVTTVLAGLVVVGLVFYTVSNLIGQARVNKLLTEMSAQQTPLNKNALSPKMPANPADNGIYFYQAAFALMKASPACAELMTLAYKNQELNLSGWPAADRKTAFKLLNTDELKLILNLFRQGAAKPVAVNDSEENCMQLELISPRTLFRLLALKSSSDGLNGNPEAGYALLRDGLRFVVQRDKESLWISILINFYARNTTLEAVNELISRYGIANQSAVQILELLAKFNPSREMKRGFDGVFFWNLNCFHHLITGKYCSEEISDLEMMEGSISQTSPFLYQKYCGYLLLTTRLKTMLDQPYWLVADQIKKEKAEIDRKGSYFEQSGLVLLSALTKVANADSQIAVTRLNLALHIYKNRHGSFPATLSLLQPAILKEIPVDPITGKPFEYRKEGNSFLLSCAWLKEKTVKKVKP